MALYVGSWQGQKMVFFCICIFLRINTKDYTPGSCTHQASILLLDHKFSSCLSLPEMKSKLRAAQSLIRPAKKACCAALLHLPAQVKFTSYLVPAFQLQYEACLPCWKKNLKESASPQQPPGPPVLSGFEVKVPSHPSSLSRTQSCYTAG